jgi:hypothetical protein
MVSARGALILAQILWTALLSAWSSSTFAASISLAPLGSDRTHAIVFLEGPLLPGDGTAFRNHVGSLTKAIVSFNSDGGNLLAGIEIGKTIRLKSFATECVCLCFAWLGDHLASWEVMHLSVSMRPMLSEEEGPLKPALGTLCLGLI